MSTINNPSPLQPGDIEVVLAAHSDETLGVVTGLSVAPLHVVGSLLYEEGVVVQSGLVYSFNVVSLNANGFNWRLHVLNDEFWPGPGSVTIKVHYIWSST